MVTISAVVLAHEHSDKLDAALRSVLFCDEIILLTDTIIKPNEFFEAKIQHKLKIVHAPLLNDFSKKRNIGLSLANSEWVFFLDSDETVSSALKKEILDAVEQKNIFGFFIKREDVFMNKVLKHGDPSSVFLLRLAKKNAGVWKRPVHEYWDIQKRTDMLTNPILHAPHDSIESFLHKINMYTSIESSYRKQGGKQFSLFELLFFPVIKFIYSYIIQLGFLDGFAGLTMSYMMSIHSLCVRIKMYEKK